MCPMSRRACRPLVAQTQLELCTIGNEVNHLSKQPCLSGIHQAVDTESIYRRANLRSGPRAGGWTANEAER